MKFSMLSILGGVWLVAALGCGGRQQGTHSHGAGAMSAVCPMPVAGTTVIATEVDGGMALVFTTTGEVGEVRQRVRRMAELHNAHPARTQERSQQAKDQGGFAHEPMPDSVATAVDVEHGAQLTLVPKAAADLSVLREHARQHADRINRGDCGPAR